MHNHHKSIFSPLLTLLILLTTTTTITKAQTPGVTVQTIPLLACTLTTFNCPNTSGCCTIGGCCGSSCCPNGYACLNEGTSSQTCCPSFDPTKCGTVELSPPTNNQNNGQNGQNNNGESKNCNTIHNCGIDPVRKLGWTCLLGKTCGFSYNQCNACPYIFNIGSGSSSVTSTFATSTTTTSSDEEEETSSVVDEGEEATTSLSSTAGAGAGGDGSALTTTSARSTSSSNTGGGGAAATTVPSVGVRKRGGGLEMGMGGCALVLVFVGFVALVVL